MEVREEVRAPERGNSPRNFGRCGAALRRRRIMQEEDVMKRVLGVSLVLALTSTALAQLDGGNLLVSANYAIGVPSDGGNRVVDPNAVYSNVTGFLGSGLLQGPTVAGPTTGAFQGFTLMDDLTPTTGGLLTTIRFTMGNFNAAAISFRPRLRIWNANGAGGGPGTYFQASNNGGPVGNIGFTFNPLTIPANTCSTVTFDLTSGGTTTGFVIPSSTLWWGLNFDSTGAGGVGNTGATQAQMNNVGQCAFSPVDVGSTTNNVFLASTAGSLFGVANPAGTLGAPGGTTPPPGSMGWELVIPEPATLGLLALGGLFIRRRR